MTNQSDKAWGHMSPDKPMLERDVPASSQDLVVSGVFSSDPTKPSSAWIGIFVFGEDPLDFACCLAVKIIHPRRL